MGDLNFRGQYGKGGLMFDIILDVIYFVEDGIHFVYAPAFDLTGYAETKQRAKKSFEIAMEEFLLYTTNKGTFTSELKKLGWKIHGPKRDRKYKPPYLDQMFQSREYLSEIVREKEFTRYSKEVAIPAMA